MQPASVISISKALEMMADLEMIISEFYKCAADLWSEDSGFWAGLAQTEVFHAENIKKIADILSRKPQEFEPGRPVNTAAINTAISGIKSNIEKLKKGQLNKKQILFISRDIEQSLLESKYTEILKTKDAEYLKLIAEIASQTESHKKLLIKRIEGA
jgi:hypothetical protein